MLSKEAQKVIDVLEKLRLHQTTIKYIEDYDGDKSLPIGNILNEHIDCDDEDFKNLLRDVHCTIHSVLISDKGGNSRFYYELKESGYKLWVAEKDCFGPLVCGIRCPNTDWDIYYG